jgi:hypothetical protein
MFSNLKKQDDFVEKVEGKTTVFNQAKRVLVTDIK